MLEQQKIEALITEVCFLMSRYIHQGLFSIHTDITDKSRRSTITLCHWSTDHDAIGEREHNLTQGTRTRMLQWERTACPQPGRGFLGEKESVVVARIALPGAVYEEGPGPLAYLILQLTAGCRRKSPLVTSKKQAIR